MSSSSQPTGAACVASHSVCGAAAKATKRCTIDERGDPWWSLRAGWCVLDDAMVLRLGCCASSRTRAGYADPIHVWCFGGAATHAHGKPRAVVGSTSTAAVDALKRTAALKDEQTPDLHVRFNS